MRAARRGGESGPSPADRARPGGKHHVITDARGVPLAVSSTGGGRNDVTPSPPLLEKIPAVAGVVGRPGRRPDMLLADRCYDHGTYRRLVRQRGIRRASRSPRRAPRNSPAGAPHFPAGAPRNGSPVSVRPRGGEPSGPGGGGCGKHPVRAVGTGIRHTVRSVPHEG
ncbi:transposase [Streptomyces hygroscopicus]|uniref:transposase n=1 Tax=Streptomyces hygroscopicus TaxID=1912 RepID=UPI00368D5852